ncbi:HD-GYP domain-containing protein [Lentibacillus saliphilus]|uniref:HD-GYP domain-containing protein n=1 Tax=Lentibacillus saliphilus TaxID=2737028 RepID=UPI001C301264|nr:HD-GYP domain-containing protein [Lentibacillus saliphilus]
MHINVSQLKPGDVVLKEIVGRSGKPIVQKKTVLTAEHISVLKLFQIESVSIVKGEFVSEQAEADTTDEPPAQNQNDLEIDRDEKSFQAHYKTVVAGFKKHFNKWQNQVPVDLPALRKLFLPLIERVDDVGQAVYKLHHLATKQDYLYHHAVSVGVLSSFLGRKMGYPKGEWLQIGLAGLLSDCGMAKIDATILEKTVPLTDAEFNIIKAHPTHSYYMIEKLPTLSQPVKLAVLQHHERQDGQGYPLGLKGSQIQMYARIVAVCDMYHAMTCERTYREKTSPFKVIELLEREQFKNLDPNVVQTFINNLYNVTVGIKVVLSNHRVGDIVFVDNQNPTRPMVRMDDDDSFIALKDHPDLFISDILG